MVEDRELLSRYSVIIGLIASAAGERGQWQHILALLADLLAAGHAKALVEPADASSERHALAYGDDFVPSDLWESMRTEAALHASGGGCVTTLRNGSAYVEGKPLPVLKPRPPMAMVEDALSIGVALPRGVRLTVGFFREAPAAPFSASELAAVKALIPHIRGSSDRVARLEEEKLILQGYLDACDRIGLGVFILDDDGLVLHRSGFAQHLIDEDEFLELKAKRISIRNRTSNRAFQRLVDRLLSPDSHDRSGDVLPLGAPFTGRNLGIYIQRISRKVHGALGLAGPALAVFVRDAESRVIDSLEATQNLFALTQTESALVISLANGRSLNEAANDMKIKVTTARTHLRSIFSKTGLQRQSGLVRLLLNSVAPMKKDPGAERGVSG